MWYMWYYMWDIKLFDLFIVIIDKNNLSDIELRLTLLLNIFNNINNLIRHFYWNAKWEKILLDLETVK